jgi:hypothetical protein
VSPVGFTGHKGEGLRRLEQEENKGINGELLAVLRAVRVDLRRDRSLSPPQATRRDG